MSIREITQVTDTEINDIKEKSAYSLPNRPTDSGLTAEQIKQHYYEPIVDDEKSIIALMKDKIDEINDALGDVATEIENVVDNVEDGTTIADKADKDSDGNKITSTYETKSSVTTKLAKKTNYGDLSLTNTMSTIYSSYGDKPFVFSVGGVMAYIGLVSRGLPVGSATFEYKMYAFELKLSDQVSIYYRTGMSGSTALSGVLSSTYKHILATKSSVDDVSSRVTDLESDYKDKKSQILDYTNHTNKPQINSVTLSGNKSWSDLGLTKAVLTGIIGAATDSADGYMSSTDHEKLTTLYALLGESADDDSFVNTINEILAIFDEYPEGADLVTALASKVSISDIVDNLTSQATNKPLSANQGYVLDGKIDFLGDGLTNLLNGTAISKKAQQDKDGNDIHSTYIKQSEKSAMEEEMEVSVLEELVGGEVTIFEGTEKEETTNFEDKIDECNEAIASIDSKANVDGNYPTMAVGKSLVTEQIENVSEESGSTQTDPFIFQATGTNNNTSETPTAPVAKHLEKQGNSAKYIQLVTTGTTTVTTISGHKYWTFINNNYSVVTSDGTAISINDASVDKVLDITEWESDVVTYLTSNPSKISNYYNGDYHYSTGEIIDSDGVTLETIGFNQWDEEWEVGTWNGGTKATATDKIRCKNYIKVIPNATYYARIGVGTTKRIYVYFLDKNKNVISDSGGYIYNTAFTTPANCQYIVFFCNSSYGTTYKNDICINLSWDGERDGEYKPFVKHTYNTGTETLRSAGSVCDVKKPDGTITRNINNKDISTMGFTSGGGGQYYVAFASAKAPTNNDTKANLICDKYQVVARNQQGSIDKCIAIGSDGYLYVKDTSLNSASEITGNINYELATPTTEQGTPFAENIEVDDYGTMGWLDGNGDYVEIPQGCKLFYPADYVLLVDDLNNYTDGDVTKLALKTDVSAEATTRASQDTILQNAIGGTLRQLLATKESLDFDNTAFVDLGDLNWQYNSTYGFFYVNVSSLGICYRVSPKMISSKYKTIQAIYTSVAHTNKTITFNRDGNPTDGSTAQYLNITDTAYTDATAFKNAMKGVLLAYEKA